MNLSSRFSIVSLKIVWTPVSVIVTSLLPCVKSSDNKFDIYLNEYYNNLEPFGVIRKNWNDTEKISMAPAQG